MVASLDEVYDRVRADDAGKWDVTVPCSDLTLHQGKLWFNDASSFGYSDGLELSGYALSQALTRLGIPTAYFNRCPRELQEDQFAYWMGKAQKDSWMLRAKAGAIRGVLTPSYERLDNVTVLESVIPVIASTDFRVQLFDLTGESFHLRLTDPARCREVLPGDRLFVGVHIANSEVGARAVTVDAVVFRLVCTNGLIRRIDSKSVLKQRHLYVDRDSFPLLMEEAIRAALYAATEFLDLMALSVKAEIPEPDHAVRRIAQRWKLPKAVQDLILRNLLEDPMQRTLYGLVNAVTLTAQSYTTDDRFVLETMAATLIRRGAQ